MPPPAPASSAPRRERFETRFNDSDTVVWNIERDPSLRTTIVAISLLDRAPDWNRLRDRILATSRSVPRLRQKVVPGPLGWGRPRWEHDGDVDLDYHLRRVVVPPPGDLDAVLELAAPIAMAAFDKARPLWEFTLVEGLSGGRAALIEKLHHAFTDGVGASGWRRRSWTISGNLGAGGGPPVTCRPQRRDRAVSSPGWSTPPETACGT